MSSEARGWLSTNVLVGFTDKRGTAWHHREGDSNHYPGPVPMADVESRLFAWEALEQPLLVPGPLGHPDFTDLDRPEAPEGYRYVPGRKAITRSDTDDVLGVFGENYQVHQYSEWLLSNVANILDDDLQIGSAGLLRGGAVAWVSVEVSENLITPEDVEFRPNLIACTSCDGSIATTYKRIATNVVCDNTMSASLREIDAGTLKVRHSKNSLGALAEARDALNIVYSIADDFAAEVKELSAIKVDDTMYERFVIHQTRPGGRNPGKRSVTMAESKRDHLLGLWRTDDRVAPWRGTAYGAWQAFNTYAQHEAIVRGAGRVERNMLNTVLGKTETDDARIIGALRQFASV